MKYKGFKFDIEHDGEEGYSAGIYRISDLWELDCFWRPRISKESMINECKIAVDDYYKNPSDYED